jgi:hypothetical protein
MQYESTHRSEYVYFSVIRYTDRSATCWSVKPSMIPSGMRERLETSWEAI